LKENFDRFTYDNFKEKEMADFRKMLFVLAGLLILIGSASAQTLSCTAFVANQPTLRQEGITEPAGDILITCTATSLPLTGAAAGPQTLSLFVSAPITSRQLFSGTTVPAIGAPTEAALLVNDNITTGEVNGASPPTQGFLQNGALVFSGFKLPTSSPNNIFTIRVTNVRVNANSVAAGQFVTGTALATFGLQNQSNLVLGAVQLSLATAVSSVTNFAQCNSTSTAGTTITTQFTVRALVNTAFKAPASIPENSTPGRWYQNNVNTESQTVLSGVTVTNSTASQPNPGTFINQISGTTPGLGDSATRIRVNFSGIPAGVTLSVPVTIGSGATLAAATSTGDLGAFSLASGTSISLTSATGSVTYQVIAQQAGAIDTFTIPVTITYTYVPPSTPNVGTILASATYAPTSAEVTTLNPTFGVPRFADTSSLVSLATISACQTDLLFTFMTNQAGFDTGFEIANTSTDPFATPAQNGTCTLNWYGTGPAAGTATTTPSIASGSYYVNLVSTAAAGFQGYMIAQCNFQFGHGFAFITDGYGQPGRGLSQGYLASIIPTPALTPSSTCGTAGVRCAADARFAVTGQGEALNQ